MLHGQNEYCRFFRELRRRLKKMRSLVSMLRCRPQPTVPLNLKTRKVAKRIKFTRIKRRHIARNVEARVSELLELGHDRSSITLRYGTIVAPATVAFLVYSSLLTRFEIEKLRGCGASKLGRGQRPLLELFRHIVDDEKSWRLLDKPIENSYCNPLQLQGLIF